MGNHSGHNQPNKPGQSASPQKPQQARPGQSASPQARQAQPMGRPGQSNRPAHDEQPRAPKR
jgi:hypothetical protein